MNCSCAVLSLVPMGKAGMWNVKIPNVLYLLSGVLSVRQPEKCKETTIVCCQLHCLVYSSQCSAVQEDSAHAVQIM